MTTIYKNLGVKLDLKLFFRKIFGVKICGLGIFLTSVRLKGYITESVSD